MPMSHRAPLVLLLMLTACERSNSVVEVDQNTAEQLAWIAGQTPDGAGARPPQGAGAHRAGERMRAASTARPH